MQGKRLKYIHTSFTAVCMIQAARAAEAELDDVDVDAIDADQTSTNAVTRRYDI